MPKKIPSIMEVHFGFSKAPKKSEEKKTLLNNLLSLLSGDPSLSKFAKSRKGRLTLSTEKLLMTFSLDGKIHLFVTVRGNGDSIQEVNSLFNKTSQYIKTVLGDTPREVDVSISREISATVKESKKFLGIFIKNEKVTEVMKTFGSAPEVIALGLKAKSDGRENIVLVFATGKENSILITYTYKIGAAIQSNFVIEEKTVLDKLEKDLRQSLERPSID